MTWGNSLRNAGAAALLACVLFGAAAQADDVVKVNRKVTYLNDTVGTPEVRECNWDEALVDYLVKYSRGQVQVTDEPLEQVHGKALRLTAVAIHTSGGAGLSGPKWLKLRADLLVDGQVVNSFTKASHSAVDVFRWTGCSVLTKMSKQLGGYTAKWLRKPVNVVDNDDAPDKDEPAEPAEPSTDNKAAPTP